jgi:hypothetical protein
VWSSNSQIITCPSSEQTYFAYVRRSCKKGTSCRSCGTDHHHGRVPKHRRDIRTHRVHSFLRRKCRGLLDQLLFAPDIRDVLDPLRQSEIPPGILLPSTGWVAAASFSCRVRRRTDISHTLSNYSMFTPAMFRYFDHLGRNYRLDADGRTVSTRFLGDSRRTTAVQYGWYDLLRHHRGSHYYRGPHLCRDTRFRIVLSRVPTGFHTHRVTGTMY